VRYFQGRGHTSILRFISSLAPQTNTIENITIETVTNGNHGFMQNDMEDDQPEHPYALEYNGVDEHVNFGSPISTIGRKSALLFAWVKADAIGVWNYIIDHYDGDGFILRITNTNTFSFISRQSSPVDDDTVTSNTVVVADKWYFVVGVRDGTWVNLYVDGVEDTAVTKGDSADIGVVSNGLYSGISYQNLWYFDGKIGIAGLYLFDNGIPTNYEKAIIKTIYNNTKGYYEDE
jgi:hypothetical protein